MPLPISLGGDQPRLAKVFQALVARGAIAERPKRPEEGAWQPGKDGEKVVMVITPAGLNLVGVEPIEHPDPETSAKEAGKTPLRPADPLSTKTTATARSNAAANPVPKQPPAKVPKFPAKNPTGRPATTVANTSVPTAPRAGTKLAILLAALGKPKGATIPELMTATGWQAHSIRGAISGALKLKLDVSSEVDGDRCRVYRIVTEQGRAAQ